MEKVPQLNMFTSSNRRSLAKNNKCNMQNSFYSNGLETNTTKLSKQTSQKSFKYTQNYYNEALKILGNSRDKLTKDRLSPYATQIDNNHITLQQFTKRNRLPQKIFDKSQNISQRPVLIQQCAPNTQVTYRYSSPPHPVLIRTQTQPLKNPIFLQTSPQSFTQNTAASINSPIFLSAHPHPVTQGPTLMHSTSVQQMPSYTQMVRTAPQRINHPFSLQNEQDHIIESNQDVRKQTNRQYTFRDQSKNSSNQQEKNVLNKKNPFSLDSAYLLQVQACERKIAELSRVYDSYKNTEQFGQKQTLMSSLLQIRDESMKVVEKCIRDLQKILERYGSQELKQSKRQQPEMSRTRKSLFSKAI